MTASGLACVQPTYGVRQAQPTAGRQREVTVRGTIKAAAAFSIVALLASGCASASKPGSSGSPPGSSTSASAAGKFLGCMVTDTGGIDDRSFNASSWQGMQEAQSTDPSKISVQYLQSTSGSDYTPNINTFIGEKCGIIVTVGFLMGDNTQTAAKANPNQKFAIVDFSY